jgi:hypothetical protein
MQFNGLMPYMGPDAFSGPLRWATYSTPKPFRSPLASLQRGNRPKLGLNSPWFKGIEGNRDQDQFGSGEV